VIWKFFAISGNADAGRVEANGETKHMTATVDIDAHFFLAGQFLGFLKKLFDSQIKITINRIQIDTAESARSVQGEMGF
jgi:hypothetical protein